MIVDVEQSSVERVTIIVKQMWDDVETLEDRLKFNDKFTRVYALLRFVSPFVAWAYNVFLTIIFFFFFFTFVIISWRTGHLI